MEFHSLVSDLTGKTYASLPAFVPELTLCVTIVLMLLVRVIWGRAVNVFYLALLGSAAGLYFSLSYTGERAELFAGMLVYDGLTAFIRAVLLGFLVLFVLFTRLSGIPDREDDADTYSLVFGATLGMCLMASANHLLMIFMAVEMASVPSYVLAGLLKGRRVSSEAALKYSVYGAGAAGIMLYGISLLAGLLGEVHLPSLAQELAVRYGDLATGELMVLFLASVMVMVGLAFKLAAVPFHFWCPDVFEGAAAEVGAFLSVASKAAALALLVRVVIGLGVIQPTMADPAPSSGFFSVADEDIQDTKAAPDAAAPDSAAEAAAISPNAALEPVRDFLGKFIAFLAIITCTFGNLAAYGQTNIKRLLAYSTIAHAGYMMMAAPAIMALVNLEPLAASKATSALLLYIGIYLFMNLGAFAIVAFLRNAMGTEEIAAYGGLIRRCPGIVICFAIILFSLVGLPPLAGFLGKFAIFAALVDGFRVTSAAGDGANYLMFTLVVGGVNTAISLFYYLRVVKVMTMDPEPADRPPFSLSPLSLESVYVYAITLPVAVLMVQWNYLYDWTIQATKGLFV